jgi:hypothetical protein
MIMRSVWIFLSEFAASSWTKDSSWVSQDLECLKPCWRSYNKLLLSRWLSLPSFVKYLPILFKMFSCLEAFLQIFAIWVLKFSSKSIDCQDNSNHCCCSESEIPSDQRTSLVKWQPVRYKPLDFRTDCPVLLCHLISSILAITIDLSLSGIGFHKN